MEVTDHKKQKATGCKDLQSIAKSFGNCRQVGSGDGGRDGATAGGGSGGSATCSRRRGWIQTWEIIGKMEKVEGAKRCQEDTKVIQTVRTLTVCIIFVSS